MIRRTAACVLSLFVLAAATHASPAPPSPPPSIPVRWTAELSINQADLDDIPAFLARPVPIGSNDNSARPALLGPDGQIRKPVTGFEWLDACDEGFSYKTNADNRMESWYRQRVLAALWLASAKPSRRSHVDTLLTGKDITDWLPLTPEFTLTEDHLDTLRTRLHRAPTWKDVYPKSTVTVKSKWSADVFDGDNTHTVVTILGYGDVTGDGMEDMLLSLTTYLDQGTWYAHRLVTLSRRHPKLPIVITPLKD